MYRTNTHTSPHHTGPKFALLFLDAPVKLLIGDPSFFKRSANKICLVMFNAAIAIVPIRKPAAPVGLEFSRRRRSARNLS